MKTVLAILLAVVSGSALAGWIEFGSTENFTAYIDSANVSEAEGRVKIWSLLDYGAAKTNAGKTFSSVKVQYECDCEQGRARKLFSSEHSGNMGKGEVVGSSYKVGVWEPVVPRSILEVIWKIACDKQ